MKITGNYSCPGISSFYRMPMIFVTIILTVQLANPATKSWHLRSPDIPTSIYALAVDPTMTQTIYAGTDNGRVFKSMDGGSTWCRTNLLTADVRVLVFDPLSSQKIYVGSYGGIYKSTDGGDEWVRVNMGPGMVESMVIDPSEPQTIYVGTRNRGLFKSTDGGDLWKQSGEFTSSVYSLAIDPKATDTIFAGLGNEGLYKSTNGGNDWTFVGFADRWVNALAINPISTNMIYAGTVNGNDGVFKSIDGGDHWQQMSLGMVYSMTLVQSAPNTIYVGGHSGVSKSTDGGISWRWTDLNYYHLPVRALTIDPSRPQTVYAGSTNAGVFKSINAGEKFDAINTGLSEPEIFSLAIDPTEPATIYAGTMNGIYESPDRGISWNQSSLDNTVVNVIVIDPVTPQTIYAGTNAGIYKSTNGASDWISTNSGLANLKAHALLIDPPALDTIFAGTEQGLYKSTNGGSNWKLSGLADQYIRALALDPSTPETVYAGTGTGVYKSIDGGNEWSNMSSELSDINIISMALDPNAPLTIYAATEIGGVCKSTNGGFHWKVINNFASRAVLVIDPSDSRTVYAASSRKIYKSGDWGENWTTLDPDLPPSDKLSMAIDPTARQTLYVGTLGLGLWAYLLDLDLTLGDGGTTQANAVSVGDEVHAGFAEISVESGPVPYSNALLTLKQNGVTISETSIPSSPPTTEARIFIDYGSNVDAVPGREDSGKIDINTGIVVIKYDSAIANVSYTLRDIRGITIASGHSIIRETGFAKFIDQLQDVSPDFNLPSEFFNNTRFASLEIASDRPLSIMALRMTINQRNEALFTTTAVADLTENHSQTFFPQLVDGGGYTTSLFFLNTSNSIKKGTLHILDEEGAPLMVKQVGGTTGSSFDYSIPAGGAYQFQTDGSTENVRVGWVRLSTGFYTAPVGSGVISYSQWNVLVTEIGIGQAAFTSHARIHVDLSENHNSGLAIANVLDTDLYVTVRAFESDGITPIGISGEPLLLPGKSHVAKYASEFIAELPSDFVGVLDVSSSEEFSALAVRSFYNERGEYLVSTLQIADLNGTAPFPVMFPRVVGGGGFETKFVFIGPGGGESKVTLHLYGDKSISLDSVE